VRSRLMSPRSPRARDRIRQRAVRLFGLLARVVHGGLAVAVLAMLLMVLPWALAHFVGWPLPDHLPCWAEVHGVLFGPMTTTLLLDVLVCLAWLAWALVTLDVVRCAITIARGARMPDLSAVGPVRRIAVVLVGSVLISVLGQRMALSSVALTAAGSGTAPPAWSAVSIQEAFDEVRTVTRHHRGSAGIGGQTSRARTAVVLPVNPVTGAHDSLWRMAERALGDGNRWPEIFALNQGKPQPDGGTFTRPGLIFPGEEMVLPEGGAAPPAAPASPPQSPSPPPESPPSSTTPAPAPAQPPATTDAPQTPPASQTTPSTDAAPAPVVSWGEELFVGLGLAAAVSAALVVARHRNRRRYRPGSGDRGDLSVAPVVYRLRVAHLRAGENDPDTDDESDLGHAGDRPPLTSAPPVVLGRDHEAHDAATVLSVGVRDDRMVAVDLAAVHGLGVLGPGAPAAIRALLVTALHTVSSGTVIVPAEDVVALLGRRAAQASFPAGLRVVADLDAALDLLESETMVRVGQRPSTDPRRGPLVLVARTPGRQTRRLQAVLDNGSTVGVMGLLLGQWNPGVTAYVRDDGTISATTPGLGEPLRGARVFRLGDDHTAELLALLRHADPDTESADADRNDRLPTLTACPQIVMGEPLPASAESVLPQRETTTAEEHAHTATTRRTEDPIIDTGMGLLVAMDDALRSGDRDLEILGSEPTITPSLRPHPEQPVGTQEQAAQIDEEDQSATAVSRPAVEDPHRAAETQETSFMPLRVNVLGPPRIWWSAAPESPDREITSAFQPRLRELLTFLALHPDGASREALIAALWATSPPEKTTNALNTSLSRLRRAIAGATENALSDVVLIDGGRYRLDTDLVEVDYHRFAAAVAARRAATTDPDRIEAYRHIIDSYTGPMADGLSTEWIETAREAIRRDAIDAVAALARAMIQHDPQQTLDLLEIARAFDPHNELIYRDIMRVQERLGQLDAIPRTLLLLTTRLAEIDDHPTQQAIELADRLRRRHDTPGEPGRADHGNNRAG
jgi:DNA-binding SARP family transcriptional activator